MCDVIAPLPSDLPPCSQREKAYFGNKTESRNGIFEINLLDLFTKVFSRKKVETDIMGQGAWCLSQSKKHIYFLNKYNVILFSMQGWNAWLTIN